MAGTKAAGRRGRRVLLASALPCITAILGEGPARPRAPDFVRDVLPILQRQGCASAYCHGAATGQGGFKLSLFGSDPAADYATIARALGGRRLDLAAPEQSLLLQKPLRRMSHGGGQRLVEASAAHTRLHAWIAGGATFSLDTSERLADLTARREGERVVVEARFVGDRGERRADVSDLAMYSSSDDRVATIDHDGRVAVAGPGEAFLFARYGGRSARLALVQPFAPMAATTLAAPTPFDATFATRMHDLGIAPAPPAPPDRLLRRMYMDLLGAPPSAHALERFASLPAATRVQTIVAELLATPEFSETLARRVASWLELSDQNEAPPPQKARAQALWAQVRAFAASDRPWPDLTERLLANDAPFLAQQLDPRDRAELVARTHLGVRVGCARCHDHPHDRWRRSDHLAFSACFADARPTPGDAAPGIAMTNHLSDDTMAATAGALFDAETGLRVEPRLLPLIEDAPAPDSLHAFVHDRRHDQAARALCNRVFAWLLGRGLVEPLDDHRDTNPATHEAWLTTLQATFHQGGQSLRPLITAIVTSRVYQIDSPDQETDVDARTRYFAWRKSKAVDRDTLRRAITAVLGVPEAALRPLPSSPLARRLELLNGDDMARALCAPGNTLEALITLGGDAREQLDALFLACLTRRPTDAERAALLPHFDPYDCAFALLSSREFEFLR